MKQLRNATLSHLVRIGFMAKKIIAIIILLSVVAGESGVVLAIHHCHVAEKTTVFLGNRGDESDICHDKEFPPAKPDPCCDKSIENSSKANLNDISSCGFLLSNVDFGASECCESFSIDIDNTDLFILHQTKEKSHLLQDVPPIFVIVNKVFDEASAFYLELDLFQCVSDPPPLIRAKLISLKNIHSLSMDDEEYTV